eukprot:COSAG01_NODE_2534_length_7489_cov_17.264953_2_plen_240_part_00
MCGVRCVCVVSRGSSHSHDTWWSVWAQLRAQGITGGAASTAAKLAAQRADMAAQQLSWWAGALRQRLGAVEPRAWLVLALCLVPMLYAHWSMRRHIRQTQDVLANVFAERRRGPADADHHQEQHGDPAWASYAVQEEGWGRDAASEDSEDIGEEHLAEEEVAVHEERDTSCYAEQNEETERWWRQETGADEPGSPSDMAADSEGSPHQRRRRHRRRHRRHLQRQDGEPGVSILEVVHID